MFKVETYAYRGPAIFDGKGYRQAGRRGRRRSGVRGSHVGRLDRRACSITSSPRRCRRRSARTTTQLSLNGTEDYTLGLSRAADDRGEPVRHAVVQGNAVRRARSCRSSSNRSPAPKLDLVADYGMLTILSQPLFWSARAGCTSSRAATGAWRSCSITFLLKLVFYPLSEKASAANRWRRCARSRRASRHLQERYKDDREQARPGR